MLQLFENQSVVEYWENFANHAFENTTQSVYSHCVLLKPSGTPVPCTFCFSIRRDIMDLPSLVIGKVCYSFASSEIDVFMKGNGYLYCDAPTIIAQDIPRPIATPIVLSICIPQDLPLSYLSHLVRIVTCHTHIVNMYVSFQRPAMASQLPVLGEEPRLLLRVNHCGKWTPNARRSILLTRVNQ